MCAPTKTTTGEIPKESWEKLKEDVDNRKKLSEDKERFDRYLYNVMRQDIPIKEAK